MFQGLPQLLSRVLIQGSQILGKAFMEGARQGVRSELPRTTFLISHIQDAHTKLSLSPPFYLQISRVLAPILQLQQVRLQVKDQAIQ